MICSTPLKLFIGSNITLEEGHTIGEHSQLLLNAQLPGARLPHSNVSTRLQHLLFHPRNAYVPGGQDATFNLTDEDEFDTEYIIHSHIPSSRTTNTDLMQTIHLLSIIYTMGVVLMEHFFGPNPSIYCTHR
jgi:hypothetical protein